MHTDIVIFDFSLFNSIFGLPLFDLELGDVFLAGGVRASLGARCTQDRMRVWDVAHARTPRYAAANKQYGIWRTLRLFLTDAWQTTVLSHISLKAHGNNRIQRYAPNMIYIRYGCTFRIAAQKKDPSSNTNIYKTNNILNFFPQWINLYLFSSKNFSRPNFQSCILELFIFSSCSVRMFLWFCFRRPPLGKRPRRFIYISFDL